MQIPDDVMDGALRYLTIILAGIPLTMLYNLEASLLQAVGNSVMPLVFLLFSSVLNVGLDFRGFALAYDSGFEAVGGDRLLFFDERRTTGSYRTDDLRREHDLRNDPEAAALERRVKAFVQQYYRHLEQKDFTVE